MCLDRLEQYNDNQIYIFKLTILLVTYTLCVYMNNIELVKDTQLENKPV